MKIALAIALAAGFFSSIYAQDTVFSEDFSGDSPLSRWEFSNSAELIKNGPSGTQGIKVNISQDAYNADKNVMKLLRIPLPIEKIQGKSISVGCLIKGEDLLQPKEPWLGPKVMIVYKSSGKYAYIDMPKKFGTFDWTPETFTLEIPADIDEAFLTLGIQSGAGTLYVTNIVIKTVAK